AYMRRRIDEVIADGLNPDRIVAVVGAFHAPALGVDLPAMTDPELGLLKRRSSKLTLMPYSFFKLSTQSGYGAGNHAPAYFEMVWNSFNEIPIHPRSRGEEALIKQRAENDRSLTPAATNVQAASLPTSFLTNVVRDLRASGT